jgi:uncharacterized protein (TIGR02145 family)
MKRNLILVMLVLIGAVSMNGQVRIGGTTTPNAGALLDVNPTDTTLFGSKGLALPRVALSATNSNKPVGSWKAGMLVYNTAYAGTGTTAVTPGTYFCNGSAWVKVSDGVLTVGSISNDKLVAGTTMGTQVALDEKDLGNYKLPTNPTTGAIVWNTNGKLPLGLYYWDGMQWNLLGKQADTSVTPTGTVAIFPTTIAAADSLYVGATRSLDVDTANWVPKTATNKAVTWSVSAGSTYLEIAAQNGISCSVRGKAAGTATLTATATDGSGVTKAVTVVVSAAPVGCKNIFGESGTKYFVGDFGAAGCWMTENVAETRYAGTVRNISNAISTPDPTERYYTTPLAPANNGTQITLAQARDTTGYGTKPGLIYTWNTATDRSDVTVDGLDAAPASYRGICPMGWHVPDTRDFLLLFNTIAADDNSRYSMVDTALNYVFVDTVVPPTYATRSLYAKCVNSQSYGGPTGLSHASSKGGFSALLASARYGGSLLMNTPSYYRATMWSRNSTSATGAVYGAVEVGQSPLLLKSKYYMVPLRCIK